MSKSCSSLSSSFSTVISKSFEGNSFKYDQLPKKLRQRLQKGQTITNLKLLISPLQTVINAGEAITSEAKKLLLNPMGITAITLLPIYLAGLTIIGSTNLIPSFNIQHHEIFFQIGGSYVVLSLCQDGLQCISGIDDQSLIARRQSNKIAKQFSESFNSKKLTQYLKQKANQPYHLLSWNCQHFADKLIKALS